MIKILKFPRVYVPILLWLFFLFEQLKTGCFTFGNSFDVQLCGSDGTIGFSLLTLVFTFWIYCELKNKTNKKINDNGKKGTSN
jgi:hypothetical protein